jgi:outer membrane lipoprotein SlyB
MKCQKYGFESPLEMNLGGNCGCELKSPADLSGKANQEWALLEPNLPPLDRTIRAKKSKVEGNSREVTIMFCGLKDQTQKLSDEEACYVMFYVHLWEGLRSSTENGILAVFGAVDELEDATQRAVSASIAIHKDTANFRGRMKHPHIPLLGIGIYTGTVMIKTVGDYQVQLVEPSDTINIAYRLEAAAEPGTTYVAEETHRLTRGLFSFQRMIGCGTGRMVGAGAGAATGAAIGAAVGKSVGSAVIGGLLGALAGGVIGHYAYDKPKDEQTAKNLNFQPSQGNLIKVENGKKVQRKEQSISVYKVLSAKKDLSTYQSCKAKMKTGDLLQWRANCLSMWFWRSITRSKLNHSSMVLRLQEYEELPKKRFTTESRWHGTVLSRLSHRLQHYHGEVWWYPLNNEWQCDFYRHKIGEQMLERIAIPYDLFSILKITFRRVFKPKCRRLFKRAGLPFKWFATWIDCYDEQRKVFCSEYCYWVYEFTAKWGKLPMNQISDLPLPDDMLRLGIFTKKEGQQIL